MDGAQRPCPTPPGPDDRFAQLRLPAHWQAVEFISDLHLQSGARATAAAWRGWLDKRQRAGVDALFILGDLFEVWTGDDALDASEQVCPEAPFLRECADALAQLATRLPIYFMAGNRDFLLGRQAAQRCGMTLLPDPTVLHWREGAWLLSHGDALCLADAPYQQFRQEVRSPAWQAAFLARPLPEREAIARSLREQSESRKAQHGPDPSLWADVDDAAAAQWLRDARATVLIHGHTHRPARHALADGLVRWVLSDWDAQATPPRADALRLDPDGLHRLPLKPA